MPDRSLALHCAHIGELPEMAKSMIDFAGDERIWLFDGAMGAGKTTLIKAVCHAFGVQDVVSSPTFALVNEYRNAGDDIFYHFDFYRIQDAAEALDMGVNEYFYSGNYCFVEWPSNIDALFPEHYLSIRIEANADNSRGIYLKKYE